MVAVILHNKLISCDYSIYGIITGLLSANYCRKRYKSSISSISEAAVNVKFQRLRVHFSRELRKEESSAHEPQPYQSKWKYYSNMLFLRDTLRCRSVYFGGIHKGRPHLRGLVNSDACGKRRGRRGQECAKHAAVFYG